jgi:putative selenate reductase FAD-binding subunit
MEARIILPDEKILNPATIEEAVKAKTERNSAFLGGGTWLNSSHATAPVTFISLRRLDLDYIRRDGATCRIGAMTTFQQIADNPDMSAGFRSAVLMTASRTLRNMITVGGELGGCGKQSALLPVLIALDANVKLSNGNTIEKKVEKYYEFRADELVLEVAFDSDKRLCTAECISITSHGEKSLVVAVSCRASLPNMTDVRIVINDGCGRIQRLKDAENNLSGMPVQEKEKIEKMIQCCFLPNPDLWASADYKRYIAGVLTADLIHKLAKKDTAE